MFVALLEFTKVKFRSLKVVNSLAQKSSAKVKNNEKNDLGFAVHCVVERRAARACSAKAPLAGPHRPLS
jgi:hypothetical protein